MMKKLYQEIKDGHWVDIYTNVVLESGEHVGQLSVEYKFIDNNARKHAPSFAVYFETDSGCLHQPSEETIKFLKSK